MIATGGDRYTRLKPFVMLNTSCPAQTNTAVPVTLSANAAVGSPRYMDYDQYRSASGAQYFLKGFFFTVEQENIKKPTSAANNLDVGVPQINPARLMSPTRQESPQELLRQDPFAGEGIGMEGNLHLSGMVPVSA